MLIGKHVYLDAAQESDAPMLAEWESDPEFLGNYYNVWPIRAADWHKSLTEEYQQEKERVYIVRMSGEKDPAGVAGYYNPYTASPFFSALELWYQIHPNSRSKGVATATACLLINHLFSALPVERIEGNVVTGNDASVKVLENAGMTREGTRRAITFLNGRYADMSSYAITRTDWVDEQSYRRGREF